jgi:hypothetical protein
MRHKYRLTINDKDYGPVYYSRVTVGQAYVRLSKCIQGMGWRQVS